MAPRVEQSTKIQPTSLTVVIRIIRRRTVVEPEVSQIVRSLRVVGQLRDQDEGRDVQLPAHDRWEPPRTAPPVLQMLGAASGRRAGPGMTRERRR